MISNEREWLNVLATINANRDAIPNYDIFKGIRPRTDYLAWCGSGATFDMQKNGWMHAYQFSKWLNRHAYHSILQLPWIATT